MMKISSGSIWFAKRILPPIWFGVLALFAVFAAINATATEDWFFVVVPLLMLPFGVIAMKKLVWTLVDGVWDGGDHLIVKNRGEEDRIPLSNLINVGARQSAVLRQSPSGWRTPVSSAARSPSCRSAHPVSGRLRRAQSSKT